MRVFLARHGQTAWNVEHRLQGRTDIELTPLGHEQARALAALLSGETLAAIYSSPLRRAMDTAWPLAHERGLEIHTTPAMIEISYGIMEGHTVQSPDADIQRLWQARKQDPLGFVAPGGESYAQAAERIRPFAAELRHRHDGDTVVVVGHRASNRVLAALLLDRPLHEMLRLKQKNDCVLEIAPGTAAELVLHPYGHAISGGNP